MSNGKGPVKAVTEDKKVQRDLRSAAESLRDASERLRGKTKKRHPLRKLFVIALARRRPGDGAQRGPSQGGARPAVRRRGGVRVQLADDAGARADRHRVTLAESSVFDSVSAGSPTTAVAEHPTSPRLRRQRRSDGLGSRPGPRATARLRRIRRRGRGGGHRRLGRRISPLQGAAAGRPHGRHGRLSQHAADSGRARLPRRSRPDHAGRARCSGRSPTSASSPTRSRT